MMDPDNILLLARHQLVARNASGFEAFGIPAVAYRIWDYNDWGTIKFRAIRYRGSPVRYAQGAIRKVIKFNDSLPAIHPHIEAGMATDLFDSILLLGRVRV